MSTVLRVALATAMVVALTESTLDARPAAGFPCYWVHGRLMAYNGNPTYRLWPSHSNRLLGVVCAHRGCSEADEILPSSLVKLSPTFGRVLWGDFRVCPLEPERAGWMRMVTIADALHVTVIDTARMP